ncbi:LONGIFOLIA 1 protein [Nymphaea thermarum]|nr:LONGIFOLIA 1 protein [Nymphaea thermarum]
MSAKLLQALTDDNPDLQKQIGCMTGIFQLFDRGHLVSGRRLYGQQHKRLPADHPQFSNRKVGAEEAAVSPRTSMAKGQIQRQRKNTDPSIDSQSSSSCSSSFSSAECNRSSLTGPPCFDETLNSQKPHGSATDNKPGISSPWNGHTNFVPQTGRQTIDFREIVKESMYREMRGLSINTRAKDEIANHLAKTRDSPRSLQVKKFVDECSLKSASAKSKMPIDLNESLRVLARLKEGPWHAAEASDLTRVSYGVKENSLCSVSREGPRFSYDGRETARSSFDSRDNMKPTSKLKELPRLSLDGRDCSSRSSNFDMKSSSNLKGLENRNSHWDSENRQSPSIVAKLMGLDTVPSSRPVAVEGQKSLHSARTSNHSATPKVTEESRLDRSLLSPRTPREAVSPRGRNTEATKRPICNPRFPIETAPWKHSEGNPASSKKDLKAHDSQTKLQASQFVLTEIEKRLKQMKFQHSEKDVRAILDAMQAKMLLDTKKVQPSRSQQFTAPKISLNQTHDEHVLETCNPNSLPTRQGCSSRAFESPIVIMKPAKYIDKYSIANSVIHCDSLSFPVSKRLTGDLQQVDSRKSSRQPKDPTPITNGRESSIRVQTSVNKKLSIKTEDNIQRNQNSQTRPLQISQQLNRDNAGSSSRTSDSLSPRLAQRKKEAERKGRNTSLPDSSKPRRQPRPRHDFGHKGGKLTTDSVHYSVPPEDQTSDFSSDTTRQISQQGDEISVLSDSNMSSASQVDVEMTSSDCSLVADCGLQTSLTIFNKKVKNEEVSSVLNDEKRLMELGGAQPEGPEQPSPVSVLDQSFYKEDTMPSPVPVSCPFQGAKNQKTEDVPREENRKPSASIFLSSPRRSLNFTLSKDHCNKLASIEDLVQKLQRLNSSHNEVATDYIASLCEKTTPDHRYVSEILLASGFLLKDLTADAKTPTLAHSSGYLINPDLFFVLEQTKSSRTCKDEPGETGLPDKQKTDHEKVHRRLIFDTVNQLLINKLPVLDADPWLGSSKLSMKALTGQRLLHEICAEIDNLAENHSNDDDDVVYSLTCQLENWCDQRKDISAVVLDIERMIFKDLVDDIVNGSGWTSKAVEKTRHLRQAGAK